ncbi:hypothetical protein, partial [Desulfovibrio legallii]|uniref:hypothetical protein n=2 Tax=Desulfovibrio legallii TaxID=571438 RepID=UPI001A92C596
GLGHGDPILGLLQNSQNLAVRKSGRFHVKSPFGSVSEILPINATSFWEDYPGYSRFKKANPNFDLYENLGAPKFAGWIFNGFDTRGGNYVRADSIHKDHIQTQIDARFINNPKIEKASNLTDSFIGDIEDMNVLVQNSIWQSVPVSQLGNFRPLKNLQDKGNWASNQKEQIMTLGNKFLAAADRVIAICK